MKTVLIVEDEKLIRQGLKTMIMRSGVPVEPLVHITRLSGASLYVEEIKRSYC